MHGSFHAAAGSRSDDIAVAVDGECRSELPCCAAADAGNGGHGELSGLF
jgi:hypothetical protein